MEFDSLLQDVAKVRLAELWLKVKGDNHGAILARGTIAAIAVKIIGIGILFGLHVLLARILGVQQYGIYAYTITWINIQSILCLFGFQASLVRFIAEYKAKQQWELLRGIISRSFQVVLLVSIIGGVISIAIIFFMRERLGGDLSVTFYIAFVLLPVFSICRQLEACLRAFKRIAQSELLLQVIRPVMLCLIVLILFFALREKLKACYVMAGNILAASVALVTGIILLHNAIPNLARRTQAVYKNKHWLMVSLPLLLFAGMNMLLKRTDIVMVGIYRGASDAGIYSVASRISDFVLFGLVAVNSILAPMISELYHTGKTRELQRIVTLAARGVFAFSFVVTIILEVLGRFVLSLFGSEFVVVYLPLLILVIGQMVVAFTGSVALIMAMSGHQKQMGIMVTASAAANIVLNLLLIPVLGLLGASVSTAITMMLCNITMLFYVRYKVGINPTIL